MLFNSLAFAFSFALFHPLYWAVPHRQRRWLLLLASFVFYGFWSLPFLLHFVGIVLLNYSLYRLFLLRGYGRAHLALALSLNLCNLIFFKYFYLLADSLASISGSSLLAQLASQKGGLLPEIVLPLAISFYSFQIMAFHMDAFRGELSEPVSAADFVLFIMFFPQLIAGPIMRHNQFLPRIHVECQPRARMMDAAIVLIMLGVFKKVVLADSISALIAPVFADPDQYNGYSNLFAVYGFAAQIYCDFAGYTDIARGLALALGFKIPANFRAPYMAESFREFWQRWHITLSTWLRDYLYIPLGGNRRSRVRSLANLMITMVLGGLWHGAHYNFLIWGMLHGFFLIGERLLPARFQSTAAGPLASWVRRIIIFHLICLGWVFFRAPTFPAALLMLQSIFVGGESEMPQLAQLGWLLLGFLLIHRLEYRAPILGGVAILIRAKLLLLRWSYLARPAMVVVVAVLAASLSSRSAAFIYFQF